MQQMSQIIYDIGMHTGKDTEFYLKKGFKVIAVEANPNLAKTGREKFKTEIASGQLVIIDKAVSMDNNSTIEFYISDAKDEWSTILPDWNRGYNKEFRKIVVETIQLSTIIETYGVPYYLKIDIEGADVLCLKSLLPTSYRPDYISVELVSPNSLVGAKIDSLEIFSYLYALGYRKFKVSDQSKNKFIQLPNPPLEGKYVDCSFGGDSSGLFGKELMTADYSLDEISKMYLDYFYDPKRGNESLLDKVLRKTGIKDANKNNVFHNNGWFDVHAVKG